MFAYATVTFIGLFVGATLVLLADAISRGALRASDAVFYVVAPFLFAMVMSIPIALASGLVVLPAALFMAKRGWRSPYLAMSVGAALALILPLAGTLSPQYLPQWWLGPGGYPLFAFCGALSGLLFWWLMVAMYPDLDRVSK
jgi:hypothetical protein